MGVTSFPVVAEPSGSGGTPSDATPLTVLRWFDIELDGRAVQGHSNAAINATTAALLEAKDSGLPIYIPPGTWTYNHADLGDGEGFFIETAGVIVFGAGKGLSVLEPNEPLVPGYAVSVAADHVSVRDFSVSMSRLIPSATLTGSVAYTPGSGIPTTIAITTGGTIPVPGTGNLPNVLCLVVSDDQTTGLPPLHLSYTGVIGSTLQGVKVDSASSEWIEQTTPLQPVAPVLTWPAGASVKFRAPGGAIIRLTAKREAPTHAVVGAVTLQGRRGTLIARDAANVTIDTVTPQTLSVVDTTGLKHPGNEFQAAGKLLIDGVAASYTGKTATTFTGVLAASGSHVISESQEVLQVIDVVLDSVVGIPAATAKAAGEIWLGQTLVFYDSISGTTLKNVWGGEWPGQVIADATTVFIADNSLGCRVRDVFGSEGVDTILVEDSWNMIVQGVANQSTGRYGFRLADCPAHPDLGENNWFACRFQGSYHVAAFRMGVAGGWRMTGCKNNGGIVGLLVRGFSMGRGGTVNCFVMNSGFESPAFFGIVHGGGGQVQKNLEIVTTKVQGEMANKAAVMLDLRSTNVTLGHGVICLQQNPDLTVSGTVYKERRAIGVWIRDGQNQQIGGDYESHGVGVLIDSASLANTLRVEIDEHAMFVDVPQPLWDRSANTDLIWHRLQMIAAMVSVSSAVNWLGAFTISVTNNRSMSWVLRLNGQAGSGIQRMLRYLMRKQGAGTNAELLLLEDHDFGVVAMDGVQIAVTPSVSVADAVTNGSTLVSSATAAFGDQHRGQAGAIVVGGTTYEFAVCEIPSATQILVNVVLPAGVGQTLTLGGLGDLAVAVRKPSGAGGSLAGRAVLQPEGSIRKMIVSLKSGSNRVGAS